MQEILNFEHMHACQCRKLAIFRKIDRDKDWYICSDCYLEEIRQDMLENKHDYNPQLQAKDS